MLNIEVMKKGILLGIIFMVVASVTAQKIQRIGYIDTEYILQNVPAYLQAQNSLDAKVGKWKAKITKEVSEIQSMKMDLSNE
ncbi:MAG: hypothetical protein CR961_01910 [Polaribacter sp.]|nr:MAG: hypothetical protein CR961_01910 [Polaribacter sp.]